jgi:hypothetical protein
MKVIWVITVLMWYENIQTPITTEYLLKSFDTKVECLDYVFWNKRTSFSARSKRSRTIKNLGFLLRK